jgi:hypothetical protein
MNAFLTYIGSIFITLLPPRYRTSTTLRGPALICSVTQVLIALFALVIRLMMFVGSHLGEDQPGLPKGAAELIFLKYGDAGTMLTGPFALVDFWIRPLNMMLGYFVFEGVVRFGSALVGHQVIGSLPFYAISGIHGLIEKKKYKAYIGELVPDHVAPGGEKQGYDLKVYSCRPKLNWNPYMTIEFEGVLYRYFKEEYGAAPRRFIYYLRKQHVGVPAVVIDHYKIDDVLKPEPDKWASTPALWERAFPKWCTPPIIPDEVVRGTARSHYDLKIYSCRRKEDWNTYVTIEFEEQWYQLIQREKGTKAHPFVYYLRKAPQTRPAVVIKKYSRELR